MFNVMIVDDEPVIRFGLSASVPWEQEGLRLIGTFSNGQEAIDAMTEHDVDILITDIKMPVMDGLTLMKKALDQFPKLKVILVSSHNDFEFVREGLKHGAVDYVLKPTLEPEEFVELIKKCVDSIKEEKEIKEKLELIEHTTLIKNRKKIEQELKLVLLGDKKEPQLEGNIPWLQGSFTMVLMTMNSVGKIDEHFGSIYKTFLLDEIQELFYMGHKKGICFSISETEMLFLMDHKEDSLQATLDLKQRIEGNLDIHFSLGYEKNVVLKELKKGFQRTQIALNRRFFHKEEEVFHYEQPKENQTPKLSLGQLKKHLHPFDKEKVLAFIKERYKIWEQETLSPADIKNEACDILTTLFVEQIDVTLLIDKCSVNKRTESLGELYHSLLSQMDECDLLLSERAEKPFADNELMERALDFIHKNFTKELTLHIVASHIHISRNYFSILFKRFSHQNFIDYVIDLRIKRAKELLQFTSLKVYEVAEQSGFNDVKYFSKLFKKMTGVSPGDYRTTGQK